MVGARGFEPPTPRSRTERSRYDFQGILRFLQLGEQSGSDRDAATTDLRRPSTARHRAKMGVTMKVTIDLPEDVSAALKSRWDDVPRRSLEAIAVEGYRTGALTDTQVRRLLQLET